MSPADTRPRRARPTIRCLVEDLGIALPGLERDLGSVDHPMLAETRRVAPTSPKGQKRILAIATPLVYRIRHGDLRGATWVDQSMDVVWLCAAERREEGSDDDTFVHFEGLHRAGALLPTDDDLLRDRAEAAIRLHAGLTADLLVAVQNAVATPGEEHHLRLGDYLPGRLIVKRQGGLTEIWCALSTLDVNGAGVSPRLRDALFASLGPGRVGGTWRLADRRYRLVRGGRSWIAREFVAPSSPKDQAQLGVRPDTMSIPMHSLGTYVRAAERPGTPRRGWLLPLWSRRGREWPTMAPRHPRPSAATLPSSAVERARSGMVPANAIQAGCSRGLGRSYRLPPVAEGRT